MPDGHGTEIIDSNQVLDKGEVEKVNTHEIMKVKASIAIAWASLAIGFAVLAIGAYYGKSELQTWATGLISGIAGAAITYGFNKTGA
jgi:predicted cobalt transporter CbtA